MAKQKVYEFPLGVEIELVAIRGNEVFKKVMPYGDALKVPRKKGWVYRYYEVGFSQYEIKKPQ